MSRSIFEAKMENGKLVFERPKAWADCLASFRVGERLQITIKKYRKPRSSQQNRYYWGAVLPIIAESTGHTVEELHEIYKRLFLPRKTLNYKGRDIPIPGSTTECNTMDFTEYIERVRAEAAALGIVVPDPSQVDY